MQQVSCFLMLGAEQSGAQTPALIEFSGELAT
jgi:hypothetical protein